MSQDNNIIINNNMQKGGANGDIFVPLSHTINRGIIKINPASHYKIDYIVNSYEIFIAAELKTINRISDDAFNKFSIFLKSVSDLVKNIATARLNSTDDFASSAPAFNYLNGMKLNGSELKSIYSVIMNGYVYYNNPADQYNPAYLNSPGINIIDTSTIPYNYGNNINRGAYNFYFRDFPSAFFGNPRIFTAIDDIEKQRSEYLYSKDSMPEDNLQNMASTLKTEFDTTMSQINNAIVTDQYSGRYEVIEKLLNDMPLYIDKSIAANFTESHIIFNMVDPSNFYEELMFKEEDILPALQIPRDTVDVALYKDIGINSIKTNVMGNTTVDDIRTALGMTKSTTGTTNVGKTINELVNTINKNNNIDATDNTLKLMYGTIFEEDGKKVAKYLNPEERAARTLKIQNEQQEFINKIINAPYGRYAVYKTPPDTYPAVPRPVIDTDRGYPALNKVPIAKGYPLIKYQTGGNEYNYAYSNNSQVVSCNQTGGMVIDLAEYQQKVSQDANDYTDIQRALKTIYDSENMQNELFFNNNEVFDLQNIEQRNEYLIEMMNVLIISRFLINNQDKNSNNFDKELQQKYNDFKNNLRNIWKTMSSDVNMPERDGYLQNLISQGYLSISQFQDFFKNNGLEIKSVVYPNDMTLNKLSNINKITAMIDDYGIGNLRKNLDNILKINTDNAGNKNIADSYQDLYSFYTELRDLKKNMANADKNVYNLANHINEITQQIGEIINRNISVGNAYISNILLSLTEYDLKIKTYNKIKDKISNAKRRSNDFKIYLNQSNQLLGKYNTWKNKDLETIDRTLTGANFTGNLSASEFYSTYEKYISTAHTSQQQILPTIANMSKLFDINKKTNTVLEKIEPLYILLGTIYSTVNPRTAITQRNILNVRQLPDPIIQVMANEFDRNIDAYQNINITRDIDMQIENLNNIAESINNMQINRNNSELQYLFNNTASNKTELQNQIFNVVEFFAKTYLYLYSDLLNKLNIATPIQLFMKINGVPNAPTMINYINSLLKNLNNLGISNLIAKTTTLNQNIDKYLELIENHITNRALTNEIKNQRRNNNTNYEKILSNSKKINGIQDYLNFSKGLLTKYNNGVDRNVGQYAIDRVSIYNAYDVIMTKLQTIKNFDEAQLITYYQNKLYTMGVSIYEYYYLSLATMYQLLNSYILENNIYSAKFADITDMQRRITQLENDISSVSINISAKNIKYPAFQNRIDTFDVRNANKTSMVIAKEIYPIYKSYADKMIPVLKLLKNKNSITASQSINISILLPATSIKTLYSSRIPGRHWNNTQIFTGNPPTFNITDPRAIRKNIPITIPNNGISIKINIPSGAIIPVSNIDELISIINTGDLALDILPDIYRARDKLEKYDNNLPSSLETTKLLVDTNEIIRKIDSHIRQKSGLILLGNLLLPVSTIYDDVKIMAQDNTPETPQYYDYADRIYKFLDDQIEMYMAVATNIIPLMLNNKIHDTVINSVVKNNIRDTNLNTQELSFFANRLPKYITDITTELSHSKNLAGSVNNVKPITIPDSQEIYDYYYTNGDNVTAPFYYLMVLSKTNVVAFFTEADKIIHDIIDFNIAMDTAIDADDVNGIPGNTTIISNAITDSENPIDSLVGSIIDKFTAPLLNNINMQDIVNTIQNKKTDIMQNIMMAIEQFTTDEEPIQYLSNNTITTAEYLKILSTNNQDILRNIATSANFASQNPIEENILQFMRSIITYLYKVLLPIIDQQMEYYLKNLAKIYKNILQLTDFNTENLYSKLTDHILKNFITSDIFQVLKPAGYRRVNIGLADRPPGIMKYILNTDNIPRDPETTTKLSKTSNMIKEFSGLVKTNIANNLTTERDLLNNLLLSEQYIKYMVSTEQITISNRINELKTLIMSLSQVMFDIYFKQTAFMPPETIMTRMTELIENYKRTNNMIENKIADIAQANNKYELLNNQYTNYINFALNLGKTFSNETIQNSRQFYKRMSFGLIEFYLDIMNSILQCLETKSYNNMAELEKYLYEYHYIQIKRCYALFAWIRYEFLPQLQERENIDKNSGKFNPKRDVIALRKKIEIRDTQNIINTIFNEFNGIKDLLDDYQTTVMPKVSLHLRINDWAADTNNADPALNDYDPASKQYMDYLPKQIFRQDERNTRNLLINFPVLNTIRDRNAEPLQDLYSDIDEKMRESPPGITFERIYSSHIFPDSDIISNYMSLAPNIKKSRGTVIMTYGYSGVGKSASLFGVSKDRPGGPKAGILQTTMDQFAGDKYRIYFRVFEIYGLGTQFNFYWNPSANDNTNDSLCYPDIYQILIHHNLEVAGSVLRSTGSIPITNKANVFSYIMNLQNPATDIPAFRPGSDYVFNKSSYVLIDDRHYRDFSRFVDTQIENRRENVGIEVNQIFSHILKQVKPTVNNPISSRSILVYDFQIEIKEKDEKSGIDNTIYVPFLIYDLPGKEDLFRTYVEPSPSSIENNLRGSLIDEREKIKKINASFDDVLADIPIQRQQIYHVKERKSSYVLNPFMIPVFDENINTVVPFVIALDEKMDIGLHNILLDDILSFSIKNWQYVDDNIVTGRPIQVLDFYTTAPESFAEMFDPQNISWDTVRLGYEAGFFECLKTGDLREFFREIMLVVIKTLIKFKLFDVIVEMIYACAEAGIPNNNWTREKIYSFFEAYYINENVIGLLQYLIKDILGVNTPVFQRQDQKTASEVVNQNIKFSSMYRFIKYFNDTEPNSYFIQNVPDLKIDPELLTSDNPRERQRIEKFIHDFKINSDGSFIYTDRLYREGYEALRFTIEKTNRGSYNNNKIFRDGLGNACVAPGKPDNLIQNPALSINAPPEPEVNRPLLQDFLEPYKQKISLYYVFYVVTNTRKLLKAEEQVKLLNNSMPFIKQLYGSQPGQKRNVCA